MICPYKQVSDRFGVPGQWRKLREECLEFAEAYDGYEERQMLRATVADQAHVIEEASDVLNVLRSLMADPVIAELLERCAATKMLRTQIRMRSGYYDGGGR